MKKGIYILSILGLLMVGGCGKKEEKKVEKPKKPVVVATVQEGEVADTYVSDGTLAPQEKVEHTIDTQGTVVQVYKKNGDKVKRGEVIVRFRDANAESVYNSASANVEAARYNLEATRSNYEKFRRLYDKELVSQLEYLNYKNAYTNAQGDYQSKVANLENARANFSKLTRKADISGVVGNLDLKMGNVVNPNTPLFTVVDASRMEVTVDFPGYWLNTIKVGSPAKVTVTDLHGKEFEATIKEINPIADGQTKKFPVKVSVVNDSGEIKDGMYAKVIIPTDKRTGMVVPQTAVFVKDLLSYVYKVENGKVKRIEVKRGATVAPNIEIISDNIKPGDQVVTDGQFGLSDGDAVTISQKK